MYDSFDAYEYIGYLRRGWKIVALACVVAGGLALGASLLLTKRYTATATIVIEAPGTATAVSPVYLESLKSYERFAGSNTLFLRAAQEFHLRQISPAGSIEGLKRQVLKVTKPRDTKLLEISATLPDPKLAQKLAEFIARQTVELSQNESAAADHDLVAGAEKQLEEARARLDHAREKQSKLAARNATAALQGEVDADSELLTRVNEDLVNAEERITELQAEQNGQQLDVQKAVAATLKQRSKELEASLARAAAELSQRTTQRDQAESDRTEAEAAYSATSKSLRELQSLVGAHSERLRIIDAGIVPERPSSPNTPLNVMAAGALAFVLSIVALSLRFVYSRGKSPRVEMPLRRAAL